MDLSEGRILVTGGLGFIARNFINVLLRRFPHAKVWSIDMVSYCSVSYEIAEEFRNSDRYTFIKGDICDSQKMIQILTDNQIDFVFHLAAATHVDDSFPDSGHFVQMNVVGTNSLLDAVHKYDKVKRVVHISTDEVYGEALGPVPADETSTLHPTNPYAAAKAGGEMLVMSFFRSFHVPVVVARPCNVFGPGQHPQKLLARFGTLLQQGQKFTIHGDGSMRRCFMFVEETADALIFICEHGVTGDTYNIESPHEYSVMQIAQFCAALNAPNGVLEEDWESKYLTYTEDRAFNDRRYFMSGEKLAKLGWKSTSVWKDIFARTINWYTEKDRKGYWGQ